MESSCVSQYLLVVLFVLFFVFVVLNCRLRLTEARLGDAVDAFAKAYSYYTGEDRAYRAPWGTSDDRWDTFIMVSSTFEEFKGFTYDDYVTRELHKGGASIAAGNETGDAAHIGVNEKDNKDDTGPRRWYDSSGDDGDAGDDGDGDESIEIASDLENDGGGSSQSNNLNACISNNSVSNTSNVTGNTSAIVPYAPASVAVAPAAAPPVATGVIRMDPAIAKLNTDLKKLSHLQNMDMDEPMTLRSGARL